jgi:hypothetical protein
MSAPHAGPTVAIPTTHAGSANQRKVSQREMNSLDSSDLSPESLTVFELTSNDQSAVADTLRTTHTLGDTASSSASTSASVSASASASAAQSSSTGAKDNDTDMTIGKNTSMSVLWPKHSVCFMRVEEDKRIESVPFKLIYLVNDVALGNVNAIVQYVPFTRMHHQEGGWANSFSLSPPDHKTGCRRAAIHGCLPDVKRDFDPSCGSFVVQLSEGDVDALHGLVCSPPFSADLPPTHSMHHAAANATANDSANTYTISTHQSQPTLSSDRTPTFSGDVTIVGYDHSLPSAVARYSADEVSFVINWDVQQADATRVNTLIKKRDVPVTRVRKAAKRRVLPLMSVPDTASASASAAASTSNDAAGPKSADAPSDTAASSARKRKAQDDVKSSDTAAASAAHRAWPAAKCQCKCSDELNVAPVRDMVLKFMDSMEKIGEAERRSTVKLLLIPCFIRKDDPLSTSSDKPNNPASSTVEYRLFNHKLCRQGFLKFVKIGARTLSSIIKSLDVEATATPRPYRENYARKIQRSPQKLALLRFIDQYFERHAYPCARGPGDSILFLHDTCSFSHIYQQYKVQQADWLAAAQDEMEKKRAEFKKKCADEKLNMDSTKVKKQLAKFDIRHKLYSYQGFLNMLAKDRPNYQISRKGSEFCQQCAELPSKSTYRDLVAHLSDAKDERHVYHGQIIRSLVAANNCVHFSFGFGVDMSLPHSAAGNFSLFSRFLRLSIFAVACETTGLNSVCLSSEDLWPVDPDVPKDHSSFHGVNSLVSMLDGVLRKPAYAGKTLLLHCDISSVTQHATLAFYLSMLSMYLGSTIVLSNMAEGHTTCRVDTIIGGIRARWSATDMITLPDAEQTAQRSNENNSVYVVDRVYNWTRLLDGAFQLAEEFNARKYKSMTFRPDGSVCAKVGSRDQHASAFNFLNTDMFQGNMQKNMSQLLDGKLDGDVARVYAASLSAIASDNVAAKRARVDKAGLDSLKLPCAGLSAERISEMAQDGLMKQISGSSVETQQWFSKLTSLPLYTAPATIVTASTSATSEAVASPTAVNSATPAMPLPPSRPPPNVVGTVAVANVATTPALPMPPPSVTDSASMQ